MSQLQREPGVNDASAPPVAGNLPQPGKGAARGERRRGRSLSQLLLRLTIVTLLPVLVVAAVLAWFSVERERSVFDNGALERTRASVTAVDAELRGSITTLMAMGSSELFDSGNLPALHEYMRRALSSQPDWTNITLTQPDGKQLLSARDPYGADLGLAREMDSLRQVVRTGVPVVGTIVTGGADEPRIPVRQPVVREGKLRYVLSAAVKASTIQALLLRQGIPDTWTAAILDSSDHFVARTVDADKYVGGVPGGPGFLALIRSHNEGIYHGSNLAGTPVYTPFARSPVTGWVVAIAVPETVVEAGARSTLKLVALIILVTLSLAFLAARTLAKRIAVPIAELARASRSLGQGEAPDVSKLPRVREFIALGEAFEQASEALRGRDEARERFAAVANNATVAIFLTDTRLACVFMNPAAERMIGARFADVRGQRLGDVLFGAQPGGAIARSLLADLASLKPRSGEDVFIDRDGRLFPVAYACGPVGGAGEVMGSIIEARDVTEARRVELERTMLLHEQTRARQEAEAASQAKDEFLAMLGHELRNPLGAISNAAYLLERGVAADSAQNATRIIRRQITHVSRLVDDLLDVARVNSGKIALSRERVDFAEVARNVIATLTAAGKANQRNVHTDLPQMWVDADRTRLEQIVSNLVSNALRYTRPGGNVTVRLTESGGRAALAVSDDGLGIEPEQQERIFDLFFQVDPNIARTQGGLGLGLTLVRRLSELHGGAARVHSAGLGLGSTFTVELPLLQRPLEGTAEQPRPAGGRRRRILVVEDNEDARVVLVEILQNDGHEVREAADGPKGLAAALEALPEVALIDIGLPGISGLEVAAGIRAAPGGDKPLLIALTGYGQPDDARRSLAAGFNFHITKPVDFDKLTEIITEFAPA